MEVDKVTDRVADMVAENKKNVISIKLEIQFGERVGHGGWLREGLPVQLLPKYRHCLN